jgi:hypothetical protein
MSQNVAMKCPELNVQQHTMFAGFMELIGIGAYLC